MVQDAPPPVIGAGPQDDLAVVEANFAANISAAIRRWAIRWAIGFAAIWVATSLGGGFGWLWGIGAVAAALSLAFSVGTHWLLRRRLREMGAADAGPASGDRRTGQGRG